MKTAISKTPIRQTHTTRPKEEWGQSDEDVEIFGVKLCLCAVVVGGVCVVLVVACGVEVCGFEPVNNTQILKKSSDTWK